MEQIENVLSIFIQSKIKNRVTTITQTFFARIIFRFVMKLCGQFYLFINSDRLEFQLCNNFGNLLFHKQIQSLAAGIFFWYSSGHGKHSKGNLHEVADFFHVADQDIIDAKDLPGVNITGFVINFGWFDSERKSRDSRPLFPRHPTALQSPCRANCKSFRLNVLNRDIEIERAGDHVPAFL